MFLIVVAIKSLLTMLIFYVHIVYQLRILE
nr:MAG TPA: hypothetical protein [Caudoviricetes sp.]